MTKLVLLTTAVGLVLGSAAIALTTVDPPKITSDKPVAQTGQAKPLSRIEQWQADKRAEEERQRNLSATSKSPPSESGTTSASGRPLPSTSNTAQTKIPASNAGQTSNNKVVAILPNAGAASAFATATMSDQAAAQKHQGFADRSRSKANQAAPRSHGRIAHRPGRDDARQAQAEDRLEPLVGQRVPDGVKLYEVPQTGREATALREYRTQRDLVRTRTVVERID